MCSDIAYRHTLEDFGLALGEKLSEDQARIDCWRRHFRRLREGQPMDAPLLIVPDQAMAA
jgi:imidazoleglycerol phosphate dehydratase HisB